MIRALVALLIVTVCLSIFAQADNGGAGQIPTSTGSGTAWSNTVAVSSLTVTNGIHGTREMSCTMTIASGVNAMPFSGAITTAVQTFTNIGTDITGVMGVSQVVAEIVRPTSNLGANTNLMGYYYLDGNYYTNVSLLTGDGSTIFKTQTNTLNWTFSAPYTHRLMVVVSNNAGVSIGTPFFYLVYQVTNSVP